MTTKIERICEEKGLNRFESESGVKNLARLANALGYVDEMHQGQFAPDGSYGDLFLFLADNPGAQEAIYEFMLKHHDAEETLICEDCCVEIKPDEEYETEDGVFCIDCFESNQKVDCKHENGTRGGICEDCGSEI